MSGLDSEIYRVTSPRGIVSCHFARVAGGVSIYMACIADGNAPECCHKQLAELVSPVPSRLIEMFIFRSGNYESSFREHLRGYECQH